MGSSFLGGGCSFVGAVLWVQLCVSCCGCRIAPAWQTLPPGCPPPPNPQEDEATIRLWQQLEELPPGADLPEQLPSTFYTQLGSYLRSARYAERIAPFLRLFPPEK